ncbi:MAG: 2-C-methyl-D-erythritol 2,4-cyclodiphosphate synthase [Thermomicrobiales bacterium]
MPDEGIRVGMGYDVHRLVEGRPLILGGVRIAHPRGLLGHSDADVLLHAITDALLGGAALGDIGTHFPPSDERWKDADSRDLLRQAVRLVRDAGWLPVNLDTTVVCETPKILPHAAAMRANIAADVGLDVGVVNVKGKTSEGLGFTGTGEGIAAYAVALIRRTV